MSKYPTIIYCATRVSDHHEVEISAKSLRNIYADDIEIILFSSNQRYKNSLFNDIRCLTNARVDFSDKILSMLGIEDRENVLFLDKY